MPADGASATILGLYDCNETTRAGATRLHHHVATALRHEHALQQPPLADNVVQPPNTIGPVMIAGDGLSRLRTEVVTKVAGSELAFFYGMLGPMHVAMNAVMMLYVEFTVSACCDASLIECNGRSGHLDASH